MPGPAVKRSVYPLTDRHQRQVSDRFPIGYCGHRSGTDADRRGNLPLTDEGDQLPAARPISGETRRCRRLGFADRWYLADGIRDRVLKQMKDDSPS